MRSARGPGALLPPYSKQRRGPRWELVISLLLNALLLLAMAYGAAKGGGGTASRTADLLEPDAAGGGGGAGGGGSLSDAEVLLDGLRQQTTVSKEPVRLQPPDFVMSGPALLHLPHCAAPPTTHHPQHYRLWPPCRGWSPT